MLYKTILHSGRIFLSRNGMRLVKNISVILISLFLLGCVKPNDNIENEGLRIISLTPANTEILFALGLERDIVGVTSYCNYPQRVQQIASVGNFSNPSFEKIISLNPTIIFTAGIEQEYITERLRTLNLNVIQIDPHSISEIMDSVIMIGWETGKKKQALNVVKHIRERIKEISSQSRSLGNKPRIFIEVYSNPLMTVGKESYINEVIDIAGGINIFSELEKAYPQVSGEAIIQRDPDIILALSMEKEADIIKRLGWGRIKACRSSSIIDDIDPDIILRPGPRIVEAIEILHKKIIDFISESKA